MVQNTVQTALIRGTGGVFLLKVLNAGLLFVSGIVLARLLGAEEYGIYAYSLTIVTCVALPVAQGWSQLLVRQVATYTHQAQWSLLRGLIRWSRLSVFFLALGLMSIGLALLLLGFLQAFLGDTFAWTFGLALLLLGILPLAHMHEAAVRGFGYPVRGVIMSQVVRPFLFLFLIALISWSLNSRPHAAHGMALQVGAHAGTLLLSAVLLFRLTPEAVRSCQNSYTIHSWTRMLFPLVGVGGMQVLNSRIDLILLGSLQGATEAGIYHAVIRCADLVVFGTVAMNLTFAPMAAGLYAQQELQQLQKTAFQCTKGMLIIAVPVCVIFLLCSHQILQVFGPDFVRGSLALKIFSCGQVVVAGFGPAGLLLNMSGNERDTAIWTGLSAGCNVLLNLILIPLYGLLGASLATTFSLILRNGILARIVAQRLSLRTTIYALPGLKPAKQ